MPWLSHGAKHFEDDMSLHVFLSREENQMPRREK
jgi:hypothetical protein